MGLAVLTEAGSRYYVFIPLIAAMAGGEEVLVLSRDSRYGLRPEILANLVEWAAFLGVEHRIVPVADREEFRIGRADIFTRSC